VPGSPLVRELVEQLERRGLRRRGADLAAAEVLQLREEARVDGDLLRAGVLEDDDRAAGERAPVLASSPSAAPAAVSTATASWRQCATASSRSAGLICAR
jgi:hypothetical protein